MIKIAVADDRHLKKIAALAQSFHDQNEGPYVQAGDIQVLFKLTEVRAARSQGRTLAGESSSQGAWLGLEHVQLRCGCALHTLEKPLAGRELADVESAKRRKCSWELGVVSDGIKKGRGGETVQRVHFRAGFGSLRDDHRRGVTVPVT
jgi:hypothetical protein